LYRLIIHLIALVKAHLWVVGEEDFWILLQINANIVMMIAKVIGA
jgi:hypothetical protein